MKILARGVAAISSLATGFLLFALPAHADPAVPGPAGDPVSSAARIAFAECHAGGPTAADVAVADQIRPSMNGPRMGRTVNGGNVSCARVVVNTVKGRGLDRRAAVIAVTTTIAESTLHNYTEAVDHDSLGLFQQRPSQGWGTPEQVTDPVYATNAFVNAMLRKYPDNAWMTGDIGAICQAVQRSGVPGAYGPEVHDAQLLVNALWSPAPTYHQSPGSADITGDGRSDLVALNADSSWALTSTGTSFGGPARWSNTAFYGGIADHVGDVNGDGKADLVAQNDESTWVMVSNGVSFATPVRWSDVAFFGGIADHIGDVNGDGKADLVAQNDGTTWVMVSNGVSFATPVRWSDTAFYGGVADHIGDVNGDGKADLVAQNNETTWVMLSAGTSFTAPVRWSNVAFFGNVTNLG